MEATSSQCSKGTVKRILFPQTTEKENTESESQSEISTKKIKHVETEKSPSGSFSVSNIAFESPKESIVKKKSVRSVGKQTVIKPSRKSIQIQTSTQDTVIEQVNVFTQTRMSHGAISVSFSSDSSPSRTSYSTREFQMSLQNTSSEEIEEIKISTLFETRLKTTIEIIETKSRFYLGLPKETYILTNF